MNRYTLIGLAVGLLVGVFIGYQAGSTAVPAPAGGFAAGGAVQMPPGEAGDNYQSRIATLQQVLARDPGNAQAWTQLGNDYFDTRQPQKAVEAYGRAIELEPNNPNVITDQGTMYRDLKQFEKAIASFERANRIDPKHMQSLYNLGVVYSSDLNEPDKAAAVWKKIIAVAPESTQAAQARVAIEQLKQKK